MEETRILVSGRDSLLIAVPFIVLLLSSVFGLDQLLATPKTAASRRRPACGIDEAGEPILYDPDGTQTPRTK